MGCDTAEVTRTVVVSDCRDWSETNATHAASGRAEACWFWFYCAKGSGDYLGFLSATTTTVRNEDPGQAFYREAPVPDV